MSGIPGVAIFLNYFGSQPDGAKKSITLSLEERIIHIEGISQAEMDQEIEEATEKLLERERGTEKWRLLAEKVPRFHKLVQSQTQERFEEIVRLFPEGGDHSVDEQQLSLFLLLTQKPLSLQSRLEPIKQSLRHRFFIEDAQKYGTKKIFSLVKRIRTKWPTQKKNHLVQDLKNGVQLSFIKGLKKCAEKLTEKEKRVLAGGLMLFLPEESELLADLADLPRGRLRMTDSFLEKAEQELKETCKKTGLRVLSVTEPHS